MKTKEIDSIVFNYINEFKQNKKVKKRNFLLKIDKDSSLINLDAYRIYMEPDLLVKGELPNRFYTYEGIKVVFFTKKLHKKIIDSITNELEEKGFYRKKYSNFLSNYPEWVILKDKKTKKQLIIKDTWYKPLDSIVKKYGNNW